MLDASADAVQALPIDIAYNRLADWLVDRRKIPQDWRKKLAAVHVKVSAALSTLPRGVDPALSNLDADCTGYADAKHVRDVLLQNLPDSRNIFRRPTGAAGEWDSIVSTYEKDSIYLGEAAQIMVQSTNYDIPYHKRQITKVQQQLTDLERKESEVKRNAVQSVAKYQQTCQELGIPGVHVRAELINLGRTVPNIFADVLEEICGELVGSALDFYQGFTSYAHPLTEGESTAVLPILKDLRDHPPDIHADPGPATTAAQAEPQSKGEEMRQADQNTTEIDWSVEAETMDTSGPVEIDWDIGTLEGIDAQGSDVQTKDIPQTVEVDWQQEATNQKTDSEVEQDGGTVGAMQPTSEINWDVDLPTEIDWNIDVEDDGVLLNPDTSHALDAKTAAEDKVDVEASAQGAAMPANWFGKSENRNKLLDDLLELKVFLKQRAQEFESEDTAALQNQVQVVAPSTIPQHGSESLMAMASSVAKALKMITNRTTRDLILISSSTRYLDRLEASLKHIKQNELNLQKNIEELGSKRMELLNSQVLLWSKQEAVIARTQAVKKLVEDILSSQYDGRTVNIIGEINTLLA